MAAGRIGMSINIERNFGERETYADILSPKGRPLLHVGSCPCFWCFISPQRGGCTGADGEVNYDLLGKILTAKSLEEVCPCSVGPYVCPCSIGPYVCPCSAGPYALKKYSLEVLF